MKSKTILTLIVAMLVSNIAYARDYPRVQDLGLIGQGEPRWDSNIRREELATIAIRLSGRDNEVELYKNKNIYKDVKGWASGYINLAKEIGIMGGTGKDTFNPKADVTYIEMLTITMRALGYEDKIDFQVFPEDYHQKAIEIGLANIYIDKEKTITRGIVAETLDKSLDIKYKNEEKTLLDKLSKIYPIKKQNESETKKANVIETEKEKIENENLGQITIEDMKFNTNIASLFSGKLKGRANFDGYVVNLSSKNGNFKKEQTVSKDGIFSIKGFDIDILTKLGGYKVTINDPAGKTIYEEDLI